MLEVCGRFSVGRGIPAGAWVSSMMPGKRGVVQLQLLNERGRSWTVSLLCGQELGDNTRRLWTSTNACKQAPLQAACTSYSTWESFGPSEQLFLTSVLTVNVMLVFYSYMCWPSARGKRTLLLSARSSWHRAAVGLTLWAAGRAVCCTDSRLVCRGADLQLRAEMSTRF